MNHRIQSGYLKIKRHPASPYLLLAAITLLAAALRFYRLGEWSFWIDEIYTIIRARSHFSDLETMLSFIPPSGFWVPLTTILTAQAFNLLGVSEWSARLVSTLVGIITIPVLYLALKKIVGTPVALIAVLLLALSPWHIFWSQNARFYTALLLFSTLALLAFYHAIEKDRPGHLVLFYVLFYFAMSERLIAGFLLPVVAVYLLCIWVLPIPKPAGFRLRNIILLALPVILFLVLQLYLFLTSGNLLFIEDAEALPAAIDSPYRLLIVIAFSIGLPLALYAFFSGIQGLLTKDRAGLLFFIAALLPILLLAAISPLVFTVERYAFHSLMFWVLLAATGIKQLFSIAGRQRVLPALAILFILLGDAAGEGLMYYQINRGNRLDWREAVAFVQQHKQDEDVIVSSRWELAHHYSGEPIIDYQVIQPEDLKQIRQPIWFIIDFPGVWHGSHESKRWIETHATMLQYTYLRTREQNALVIYYYDPRQGSAP